MLAIGDGLLAVFFFSKCIYALLGIYLIHVFVILYCYIVFVNEIKKMAFPVKRLSAFWTF